MNTLTVAELAMDAEREFRVAFGSALEPKSCRTFAESSFRGGFHLVLSHAGDSCEVVYSDMQLEVSFNGKEVFGTKVHIGFEGNMFSREHLREYLARIAASAAAEAKAGYVQGQQAAGSDSQRPSAVARGTAAALGGQGMTAGSKALTVTGWLLIAIGVLATVFLLSSAVLLRDGLGPDSVPSHGAVAVWRVIEGFAVPGVLSAGIFCAGIVLVRRSKRGDSNA